MPLRLSNRITACGPQEGEGRKERAENEPAECSTGGAKRIAACGPHRKERAGDEHSECSTGERPWNALVAET